MKIPSNFRQIFSAAGIEDAIARIAEEITPWALDVVEQTGKEVIAVPVLRGGIVFFADLVRHIEAPLEWQPVRATAYHSTVKGKQLREVEVDLMGLAPAGRSVLVVDEICDSGRTYARVKEMLLQQGATTVKTVALIQRRVGDQLHKPDYTGFSYPGSEWLAGYGLKGGACYGNLPDIYAIENQTISAEASVR